MTDKCRKINEGLALLDKALELSPGNESYRHLEAVKKIVIGHKKKEEGLPKKQTLILTLSG